MIRYIYKEWKGMWEAHKRDARAVFIFSSIVMAVGVVVMIAGVAFIYYMMIHPLFRLL